MFRNVRIITFYISMVKPSDHSFKRLVVKWKLSPLFKKYCCEISEKEIRIYCSDFPDEIKTFLSEINKIISHHYFYCAVYVNGKYLDVTVRRFSIFPIKIDVDYVYHVTKKCNIESILLNGLEPRERFDFLKGCFPLSFHSTNYNELWYKDEDDIILRIKSGGYRWFKDTNLYRCKWSVCTNERIKVEDIKVLDR